MNDTSPLIEFDEHQHTQAEDSLSHLGIFSAFDLGRTEFPAIKFIVPGYLPEGATILAGRPKLGKSWLALDLALAVAKGSKCLGVECEQGDVLYLALEDNKRRLQSRLHKLSPAREIDPWPRSLEMATESKRHDAGGIERIRNWAVSRSNPRLVIVDVLAQFRGGRGNTQSQYEADYDAVKSLQQLAGELQIAILIIHHVRKGIGEIDPFEKVSGTMGLTGAADTTIILDKDQRGCTLYCRGRDIQEYEKAVSFEKWDCRWVVQGEANEVRRTDERSRILDALLDGKGAITLSDICDATGMPRNNVKQLLFKMAKAGEVNKVGRGEYIHPDVDNLQPPDNFDNQVTKDEYDS